MSALIIYEKPTCTTCRNVSKILKEEGVNFEAVNYFIKPLSEKKLKQLIGKMKIPAVELLRKKEARYKDLALGKKELSDDEAIKLMVKYPELLQRPIAEKGAKAVLARPAEKIKDVL